MAVLGALELKPSQLKHITIKQRALDARKRSEVQYCYTLLAEVDDEAAVLARKAKAGWIEATAPGHARAE